jgi:flagellar assembly protein FliH
LSKPVFSPENIPGAGSKNFSLSALPGQEPSAKTFRGVSSPPPAPQGVFPFGRSLKDLEDRLLKNVQERALKIEQEAYEKGFAQGEKDGLELGFKRLEANIQAFQKILEEMQAFRKDYHRRHEGEMVRFLLALVRRILKQDFPNAEETAAATLREALRQAEEHKKARIRLHPKDYEFLKTHPERLPFALTGESPEGPGWTADPSIPRGGCLIETPFGDIDATLESQLDQIAAGLWGKIAPEKDRPSGSAP